ncbi:cellulose synthase [Tanacetum coccineum]|uniref:Cellulose synthase n=1 Tax=Tanacetum coccineum TaxID=301880 RepID=A0ABQ5AB39_9ASTR
MRISTVIEASFAVVIIALQERLDRPVIEDRRCIRHRLQNAIKLHAKCRWVQLFQRLSNSFIAFLQLISFASLSDIDAKGDKSPPWAAKASKARVVAHDARLQQELQKNSRTQPSFHPTRPEQIQGSQQPRTILRMAASSSTASFSLDLYHNGYFKLKPLTYVDSEMVTMNIDVTGLNNIKCDVDFTVFVENWQSNEDIMAQLYLDHRNADLGNYIGKDLGDNILFVLKPGYDFDDSDDEFSDVASLDHLFEGEKELREVRIKKRKSLEEKNKSNEDADDENDDSQKEKVHVEPEINSDEDMPIMDGDEIVLVDYAGELRKTNPGTIVHLSIDPFTDGTHVFNSFYVCFHNLKKGWKAGCRKVIGLDGCFLKGVCQGELLAAIGRDGNNQIYPISWAVVQVESTESWKWFVKLLTKDLGLADGHGITFISDGHKGLI